MSPVVAALLTERAAASRGFGAAVAIQFATVSVLVGSLLSGVLFAILDGHDPGDAVGFALVGLLFLGIPLLILGVILALLWVTVVRWLLPSERAAGFGPPTG